MWLFLKQNCKLRENNQCFTSNMKRWVIQVVDKTRHLFADRGGPIIMSQVKFYFTVD